MFILPFGTKFDPAPSQWTGCKGNVFADRLGTYFSGGKQPPPISSLDKKQERKKQIWYSLNGGLEAKVPIGYFVSKIMDYQDRHRAEGFGSLADQYERTRPSYPVELIERLSLDAPGTAVDVGCGTGRVAILLGKAGWKVVGIEPDPRMAEVARSHGVKIIVTTFEHWDSPRNEIDLITAGTSWHWVDPKFGYDKAALVLRPGGTLAIFRNSYHYAPLVSEIIESVLKLYAPHLLSNCIPLGTNTSDRIASHRNDIESRGDLFENIEYRVFKHERRVSVDDWVAEIATHSPIMSLSNLTVEKLCSELSEKTESNVGNIIRIEHDTHALIVKRRF
jgi:SAM-dependent methyltransferase